MYPCGLLCRPKRVFVFEMMHVRSNVFHSMVKRFIMILSYGSCL